MKSVAKAPKTANRHTPSTSWMWDIHEMIYTQYQKNPFIIVGKAALKKKVYELTQ